MFADYLTESSHATTILHAGLPVENFQVEIYLNIEMWKAKSSNIYTYIYIHFFIYTKYTDQSSQTIHPNPCIVKTSASSLIVGWDSLKVLSTRTELRRRRTPLPTRLRRLWRSLRRVTVAAGHHPPVIGITTPRMSQGSVCICLGFKLVQ